MMQQQMFQQQQMQQQQQQMQQQAMQRAALEQQMMEQQMMQECVWNFWGENIFGQLFFIISPGAKKKLTSDISLAYFFSDLEIVSVLDCNYLQTKSLLKAICATCSNKLTLINIKIAESKLTIGWVFEIGTYFHLM